MTYDPANPVTVAPAGGCQSGVSAFRAFYMRVWDLPSLGCYNPASVLPDGSPSLHRDGRAEDVGHDGSDEQINRVWLLCSRLVYHSRQLGVQQILYRGMGWRESSGWRLLSGNTDPHMSHAHIEFTIRGSTVNTWHDYAVTIGVPPMDQETIENLAKAIVREFMTYPVPVHDYDADKDTTVPFSTWLAYSLAEGSQIRRKLTGQ